ncbi:NAD(P)-binding domain-containing protein [Aliifodinibius sp. S!AR15-10]|uniref:NADPH-dependent F420 reductase n=1 Tax=Aliifodinibius sp. S!AR15-10 TaxID=2950437 RepID=UPI00285F74D1|nr:NAD(P)-binding domain-containing protein [Aliifodinibius sp. S!AR15-10]MDR8390043.1 NAD(P)-binding domain-containing protein [Aliifodinibius sp. S!AR15-10]
MPITKQTIAIIGAGGSMGSAIAIHVAGGNYRLLLFDQDSGKLPRLKEEIQQQYPNADVKAMDCAHDCSWEADIIILAIPHDQEKQIADKIRDVATQKVVVSIANPVDEDFSELTTDPNISAAEELQQWLPHSKVVKAFNTTFAADFEQPVLDGQKFDSFIAGNDEQAIETVTELIETVGFNPIKIDDLVFSRTLERMQFLLLKIIHRNDYQRLAGWKVLHN